MFLDVKELAVRKLSLRKSYAPGAIDYQTSEIKQVEPLEVTATAELFDGTQIRITGELETKLELACARCLEPVTEEVHRSFDSLLQSAAQTRQAGRRATERRRCGRGFYKGDGVFLTDVLTEQVLLAVPMKAICRSDLPRIVRGMRREPKPRRVPLRDSQRGCAPGSPGAIEARLAQETIRARSF